jgi:hypothetical protein
MDRIDSRTAAQDSRRSSSALNQQNSDVSNKADGFEKLSGAIIFFANQC